MVNIESLEPRLDQSSSSKGNVIYQINMSKSGLKQNLKDFLKYLCKIK